MELIKSIKQNYQPDGTILHLLDTFRHMVNDCIRIGLDNNVSSMKRLSLLSYRQLEKYDVYSNYKLCAISRTAGILSTRKKSLGRGFKTKNPYAVKPLLIGYMGFKIIERRTIRIPLGDRKYFDIHLSNYVQKVLSDPSIRIRSFTLTSSIVSISYSKNVEEISTDKTAGIDRNVRNLTYGNCDRVIQYDLSQTVDIAETTKEVIKSFKRNDIRIRSKLASKYGRRRKNRPVQIPHRVSKNVVLQAKKNREAIVFEDIRNIRRLYQRGNGQGRQRRGVMNSWSFAEVKRQIEYKAKWEGLPIIQLSVKETRGTSSLCPQCGERLQESRRKYRQLWCSKCNRWLDRDVVAVMNQSLKGWVRFAHSKGMASEAMKGNLTTPVILRVDAMKLGQKTRRNRYEPMR